LASSGFPLTLRATYERDELVFEALIISIWPKASSKKTTFLGKSRSVAGECGTLSKVLGMDGFYLDKKKWWIKILTP